METQTGMVKRDNVEALVRTYERIKRETVAGFKLLNRAQSALQASINQYGRIAAGRHNYPEYGEGALKEVLEHLKRDTWTGIVNKLQIRGCMDSRKRAELDKQLETGEGLPDIDSDAILGVIAGMVGNLGNFTHGQICEAFELMRRKSGNYKSTGGLWEIEGKVVLGYMVQSGFSAGRFRNSSYRSSDDYLTIENAFRLLDGKGPVHGNATELEGAVNSSPNGEGETTYFRFRAHKNGNLHLWFKRMDLVKDMNGIAGGGSLKAAC